EKPRHGRMTIWLQRWVEAEIKPPLKLRFGFIHRHKMTTARWRTRSLAVQTPLFYCLAPAPTPQRAVRNLLTVLAVRSEEHTSELQSRSDLVCRLLLEKKK